MKWVFLTPLHLYRIWEKGLKRGQMERVGVREGPEFLDWHSQESLERREGEESSFLLDVNSATHQGISGVD